jgi:hypothetical protein
MAASLFISFLGLYAILVCVARCQLEKLGANLLSIGGGLVTTAQETGISPGSDELQKQLNECIRHHQIVMLYVRDTQYCA